MQCVTNLLNRASSSQVAGPSTQAAGGHGRWGGGGTPGEAKCRQFGADYSHLPERKI